MKDIPPNEHLWLTIRSPEGTVFYITTKSLDRSWYYLYRREESGLARLGRAHSPIDLERQFIHQ